MKKKPILDSNGYLVRDENGNIQYEGGTPKKEDLVPEFLQEKDTFSMLTKEEYIKLQVLKGLLASGAADDIAMVVVPVANTIAEEFIKSLEE